MTKRILQIVLLGLVTGPASLSAVDVPQTSAADYIFSTPRLTNHIHGVLIDATNSYGVIRSEDIDWIIEALSERQSLVFGRIGNLTGVGPVVRRLDMPDVSMRGAWLDGDAPLLSGIRFYRSGQVFTNISTQATYTNGVTNAFSVITMPLTNGTVSVFTNSWSIGGTSYQAGGWRFPATITVTNVYTCNNVDYCHGVEGVPFPERTNAAPSKLEWLTGMLCHIPSAKYVTSVRESLRDTVRLADDTGYFTNNAPYIIDEFADGGYYTDYNVDVGYNFDLDSHEFRRNPASTAYIPTRFDSSLATNRVAIEALYAYGTFSYSDVGNNFNNSFMMRLSTPILDLSTEKAVCRIFLDPHAICSACASAAGVPEPPSSLNSGIGTQAWHSNVESFVVFYRITPSVRLPSWIEFNPD